MTTSRFTWLSVMWLSGTGAALGEAVPLVLVVATAVRLGLLALCHT
jgi:hypothetical protein